MLNKPSDSNSKQEKRSVYFIPDPWEGELPLRPKSSHPSWQFPLKPDHEISAAPAAEGMLSSSDNPAALKLAPNAESDATTVLLEEEMKVDATQEQTLWDHIRDAFALIWWRQRQTT